MWVDNICAHTAEGDFSCVRRLNHPGAHRAETGEWWPYAFESTHYTNLPPFSGWFE